jgi:penicillin-binding protein 2
MSIESHLQEDLQERTLKSSLLTVAVSFLFLVLFARLVYLQVIEAQLNLRLSLENGMQLHVLKAPRGRILDRNGEVLARNRPSYSVCVLPYRLHNRPQVIRNLLKIRDTLDQPLFDSADLIKRIRNAQLHRFDPSALKEDVGPDIVSIVEEHSIEIPGIVVEAESRREYPLGLSTFHALGYMSEIPEESFDSLKQVGYLYGDRIGKAGIEKQYEDLFRGKNGREYIEVNAYGKRMGAIKDMPREEPERGCDLYLTLDARLQRVAAESFPDTSKGAAVAINPRNGEVLLMLSRPSVDPNIFSMSTSARAKSWAAVALDPALPLNNRAVSGTYSPGSTFKLISALSGLATGRLNANSYMPASCTGIFRLGKRVAHCWKADGHGRLPLLKAVQVSCNVYFYQVGLALGDKVINKYASLLGLGSPTGVDMPGEKSGWISGEEAYNQRFANRGWRWTAGLACDLAIGQAQLLTPIQLANMGGALGNGKVIYQPHLLARAVDAKGAVVKEMRPTVLRPLNLDPAVIATMHEAMQSVVGDEGGTGGAARVPGVTVGGKTGSAQNPQGEKTHALFVCCAPLEDPVIAVAVVVENAGHGGSIAAPIAGQILRYYFTNIAKPTTDTLKVASAEIPLDGPATSVEPR